MKQEKTKDFAKFMGVLLAMTSLLFPVSQYNAAKTHAVTAPASQTSSDSVEYTQEGKLFDSDVVHTIDVHISDKNWNDMISHATEEQYVTCDVEIDGDLLKNVAIRPKGNSSLSSISEQGSTHFSFKIEFDHNDPAVTYYGLDKLCLNNLGQDPSCMKDFMAYHLMQDMGVAAPLSSYTLMQVNGHDFGLYLAVEAVEDAFCYRNYGEEKGQLYKPDSFSMDTLDTSAMLEYSEGSSL
ncbi:MAG: CotH kinase family protein [Oscillospiraceae bacterium]